MNAGKKKLEVLFKAFFQADKTSEAEIRKFLEGKIDGIKIKSIETFTGKTGVRAVVTSNVVDILTGEIKTEDSSPGNYVRMKSQSFMGGFPGLPTGPDPIELEMKEKEIQQLSSELSKIKKELADAKKEVDECKKHPPIPMQDISQMFQQQITDMSHQVETLDNEKTKLDKINKALKDQIDELKQKLEMRNEADAKFKGGDNTNKSRAQADAAEALLLDKQKQFKEEKEVLEDKLAQLNLKVMLAQESSDKIAKEAELGRTLKESVGELQKEKDRLAKELQEKIEQIENEQKIAKENEEKTANLEKELAQKIAENQNLLKKLEDMLAKIKILTEESNSNKSEKETFWLQKTQAETKAKTLEKEKASQANEIEQLNAQLKEQKQALSETSRENNKQIKLEQEKKIKEKEELIRDLKIQIKEKENSLEEIENEHKAAEKERESKLSEAEEKIKALTKQIEEMQKNAKKEERKNSKTKQKIESLEQELKKKEAEIKVKEEQIEKELTSTKTKLLASEKTVASDAEEIMALKMKLGSFSTNSSFQEDREVTEQIKSKKTIVEPSPDTTKIKKQLDDAKLELAGLSGRYLEQSEELNRVKEKLEKLEREDIENKSKLKELLEIKKKLEDYEFTKRELADIKAKVEEYKRAASEKKEAVEIAAALQSQYDTLKKQNLELKDALFQAENKLLHSEISGEHSSGGIPEEKKMNVVEEIKQYLAEVLYVYKTLDTNTRELKEIYSTKKEKLERYREIAEGLGNKKNKEKIAILKDLSEDFGFINVIQVKEENLKLLIPCLLETINLKMAKLEPYENQLMKFDQMINVAKVKLEEYDQKLNLF